MGLNTVYVFPLSESMGCNNADTSVQVKKVEDVVYDLSLRNLIPKGSDNV